MDNFLFRDDDPEQKDIVIVKPDDREYKYTKPDGTVGTVTGEELYSYLGGRKQAKLQQFGSNISVRTLLNKSRQIVYKVELPDCGALLGWSNMKCIWQGDAASPISFRCIPGEQDGNIRHGKLALNEFYIPFEVSYPDRQDMFSHEEDSIGLVFGDNKFVAGVCDNRNYLSPIMIGRPRMAEDGDTMLAVFTYKHNFVGGGGNYVYDMEFNTKTGLMILTNRDNPDNVIRSELKRLE